MANTQFSKAWRWLTLPIGTPFELVAADIFGPVKPTARGRTHILMLIDHHTRWMELIALPEPTAELVAEAIFEHWISRLGTMRALMTDNGRQFAARLLQQLTDIYGIKHIYSSPYHPRGNSVVESYKRTLKTTLKLCTQAFQADWDVALQEAALAYLQGIGEVKKTAERREWGEVLVEVARALVECRRNRSDTRFHVPRLWNLSLCSNSSRIGMRCMSTSSWRSAATSRDQGT